MDAIFHVRMPDGTTVVVRKEDDVDKIPLDVFIELLRQYPGAFARRAA